MREVSKDRRHPTPPPPPPKKKKKNMSFVFGPESAPRLPTLSPQKAEAGDRPGPLRQNSLGDDPDTPRPLAVLGFRV